jgi:hypothetical protein
MSKALQWIIGLGVVLIVASIIFSTVWPFFAPRVGWSGYDNGMMGPGHMWGGRGMLGEFGMPLFAGGMFIWPLLVIGLIVAGVAWLVRGFGTSRAVSPPAASLNCAHCGRPLQADWKACPYCGEKV